MPEGLMRRLQAHLFSGDDDEHGAVIVAGVSETERGTRLLARELFQARDGIDYVRGERGYRMLKAEFIADKVLYCREQKLAYLAVHCHLGSNSVEFSPDDLASHQRGYPSLSDIAGGQPVGALVLAHNAVAGDIWLPDRSRAHLSETVVVGRTVQRLYPSPQPRPQVANATYDRQSRIFGDRGQRLLSNLKVGIIGAGGAGSLINEYLARLGVGYLVVADPERLDKTNKPRVVGSTDRDVATKACKVDIAERVAKDANPKIIFDKLFGNVVDDEVARHFIDCDYIFLAADTMQARLAFNSIVHQYLIPGIQVGAKVPVDRATGNIGTIFCASRPVTPETGCLWCNGLISPAQLQDEAKTEDQRLAQRYVEDQDITAPSVVTLNAIAAAHAANDFLFGMTGLFSKHMSADYLRWLPTTNDFEYNEPRKDPDCIECGTSDRSRFARGNSWTLPTK